jgi:hypothetical protein
MTTAPASTAAIRPAPGRRRHRFAALLALAACVAMIPWTLRLAATLPDRYVAHHWSATWVGFDTLLLISFAITSWAIWRHHRAVVTTTMITVTLLGCDAWFDMTTVSNGSDLMVSGTTAAAELVLGALLLYLVRETVHHDADRDGSR